MTSKQRLNVFLDLDNTLICSENLSHNMLIQAYKYTHYAMINPYITVERPYLQLFLDYLFSTCNVSVWTAASKNYASFVIQNFIKKFDSKRNLDLVLYNEHCDVSVQLTNRTKSLSLLWDYWNVDGYNKSNTIIIDDLKSVYLTQPENAIKIKPFYIVNGFNDRELLKILNKIMIFQKRLEIKN